MYNEKLGKETTISQIVGKNRKERRNRRKLIIAALGLTKSGKTSFITSLAKEIEKLISLFLGDKNRTKVTVDYHFVTSLNPDEQDLMIEDIQFRLPAIAKSNDFSKVDKFNDAVENNAIYKLLQLQPIEESDDFESKLQEMLNDFVQKITPKNLAKILNTEGVDDYIKKITILIEATPELAAIIDKLDVDLYMRDTRGIMDLALQKQENGTKITNIRSLSDLGLDGLNGVLFFCSRDGYTNNIIEIYENTLKNIFKSVPVFLIRRSEILPLACQVQGTPNNVQDAIEFIEKIQERKNPLFKNVELDNFQTTLKLLADLKVTQLQDSRYVFKDLYFNQDKIEFLIPDCGSLTSASTINKKQFNIESSDYQLFRIFSMACINQVLNMVSQLHQLMEQVVNGNLSTLLQSNKQILIDKITEDFKKYDYGRGNTEIVRPQLETQNRSSITHSLVDPNYTILGPRGGITTVRNGTLRYAPTAILAVSSRIAISNLIEKISISDSIIRGSSENIPEELQIALIKKSLNFVLYKGFTDNYATVRNYLIVPRESVKDAIENTRKNGIKENISLETSIGYVIDSFCNKLNSSDISELFTN